MSRFREQKSLLKTLLAENGWLATLDGIIADPASARRVLNPLLALLARPELHWQAAYGLGLAVPLMALENMESARVVMRRFMWSLNEESGNLGWGIPEAMACILANSPPLSREYARIFFSYGYETGKDDNFIDHAPLRRGVYWGMGRIAQKDPGTASAALPHLAAALADEDRPIRGYAAWALTQLAGGPGRYGDAVSWQEAKQAVDRAATKESEPDQRIELFDGNAIVRTPIRTLFREASGAAGALIRRQSISR